MIRRFSLGHLVEGSRSLASASVLLLKSGLSKLKKFLDGELQLLDDLLRLLVDRAVSLEGHAEVVAMGKHGDGDTTPSSANHA